MTLLFIIIGLGLNILSSPIAEVHAEGSQYFSQTGHSISGKFLDYWNANGGLKVFGYPLTDAKNETDSESGQVYLTQWFERNRFELHPEFAGTKYEIELGLLGKTENRNRIASDPTFQPTNPKPQYIFFSATGHNVSDRFYQFWQNNGGLDRFGFPIDEEQQEIDPASGKLYLIQWFERARMEYHPENSAIYQVELGLLGYQAKDLTPDTLLNIYFAAIDNKVYQQAYAFWENNQNVPEYNKWLQSHANTVSSAVTIGSFVPLSGDGQAYANIPTVVVSTQSDGSIITLYGCYVVHHISASDKLFWNISNASLNQDDSNSSTATLMVKASQICKGIVD